MRITCPNCGAQYEVPDDVVPDEGRDVQCSNCGDTWFQTKTEQFSLDELPDDSVEDDIAAESVAEAIPEDAPEPDLDEPEAPIEDTGKRAIAPSVANILREEAQHEARIRASENTALESQGDLGLESLPPDGANQRAREARERMDRLRGQTEPAAPEAPEEPQDSDLTRNRSRLLPDVEEVSSALRSEDSDVAPDIAPEIEVDQPARRSGFARGFILVVLVVVVLFLIYANAGKIATSAPALEPAVNGYVTQVDKLRIWLDSQLSGFIPE